MYRRLPCLLVLVALSFVPDAPLPAQESEMVFPLAAGQHARVTYRQRLRPTFGEFVSADSQALAIRDQRSNYVLTIPWEHIARLDASVGQRSASRSVGRGLALGFLSGAGLGTMAFIVVEVIGTEEKCRCDATAPIRNLTIVATPVTTVLGGILGAVGDREIWQRVPTPAAPPRLTIGPVPGGNVGFALGFGW